MTPDDSSLTVVGSGIEPEVPERTQQLLSLLEKVAPPIGARWARELWCTPPVMEASARMPPGVGDGEPLDLSWEGHRIAGTQWGNGPLVCLVHGWGGNRSHLGLFVKPLVDSGFRVVAFDLPAHNESEQGALAPGRTTVVEAAKAVKAVIDSLGPAHAVIAHSFGAKCVALAATWGAGVGRLVFLAPMADFDLYLDFFAVRHSSGPRIRAGMKKLISRRIGMDLSDTDIVRTAPQTGFPPLLVLHDPDDLDTPYGASEQVAAVWSGSTLEPTKGLGRLAHYRILRHRPAVNRALEFVTA